MVWLLEVLTDSWRPKRPGPFFGWEQSIARQQGPAQPKQFTCLCAPGRSVVYRAINRTQHEWTSTFVHAPCTPTPLHLAFLCVRHTFLLHAGGASNQLRVVVLVFCEAEAREHACCGQADNRRIQAACMYGMVCNYAACGTRPTRHRPWLASRYAKDGTLKYNAARYRGVYLADMIRLVHPEPCQP